VSRVALLDVNVLVALFDPDHVHHELAHDWFADDGRHAWATCPIAENGFVRVLSNPAYGGSVARVPDLVARLRRFCAMAAGHRRLTDIYLLGVAHSHGGRLATFDRSIPMRAVVGASAEDLAIIAATV
jgi:predicted nucleic acid-binding protein